MVTATANPTAVVLGNHVQALVSRNLDAIAADYSDDAVVFTPNGTFKGPEQIRAYFSAALNMLTPEALNNLTAIKQEIDGEFAYVIWSALPVISFAGDSFCIRNGKIVMQSVVMQVG